MLAVCCFHFSPFASNALIQNEHFFFSDPVKIFLSRQRDKGFALTMLLD